MSNDKIKYMEKLSKVIAISNHKGGVGKTTSALNIGAGLNKLGYKVLLIDLDAQCNLTQSLGITQTERNVYGAIKSLYPLSESIIPVPELKDFYIVPATVNLTGLEIELSNETGREYLLRETIEPIKKDYDFILIDCPPSLNLLTINALTVAEQVIIPLQSQYLALQGLTNLLDVISKIQKRLNPQLTIGGVIITQFDKRIILNREIAENINSHFKDQVFKTKIRDNIAIAEAPANKLDIFRYNPNCNGAEDYLELSKEILNKLNHK